MTKVFIDGRSGTTGLKIDSRLANRSDLEQIVLSDSERRDPAARKAALNDCDIAFLCLPDDAARESVSFIENPRVKVIDTSTAHRTSPDWAYGFPELSEAHLRGVLTSSRVAVPGCHASGFIALVYPLVTSGLLSPASLLTCHSLTGYSGGGKTMIADYDAADRPVALSAPRQYGLTQSHKHLKEMVAVTGLSSAPIFCPIVDDYFAGMLVTVPLFAAQLRSGADIETVRAVYRERYGSDGTKFVRYEEAIDENGMVSANALAEKDYLRIGVTGNEERMLLMAQFDNLGKGASGAAIQCMNLMLGINPAEGLSL